MEQELLISSQTDNLSLVLHKIGDLRLEQTPIPEIRSNECLLRTHSCGICGTDIHLLEEGRILDHIVEKPHILGHETSADVIAVGKDVKHLKPGDRVAVEPTTVCLKCDLCRDGRYNLCVSSTVMQRGLPPHDGCLRRYFAHEAIFCHKLTDNISYEEGALCEPLAVVVHGIRRVKLAMGDNVLICGAGTMGMLSLLCAKAFGANKVFITDINSHRLEMAKKLGADATYLIDRNENLDEIEFARKIQKDMGDWPNISLECSGSEWSTSLTMYATKIGGKVGLVGIGAHKINVPLVHAAMREIDIIGVCRFKDDFPLAIQLISSGKLNVKPLITHAFKIEDYLKAFNLMKSGTSTSVKILIQY